MRDREGAVLDSETGWREGHRDVLRCPRRQYERGRVSAIRSFVDDDAGHPQGIRPGVFHDERLRDRLPDEHRSKLKRGWVDGNAGDSDKVHGYGNRLGRTDRIVAGEIN